MLSPGISTTNAVDVLVDIEVDEFATLQLVGMSSVLKVFLSVIPGTDAERLTTVYPQRMLWRRHFQPAHISAATIVLRMDIVGHPISQ